MNPWDLIAKNYDKQFGDEGDFSHKFVIYPTLLKDLGDVEDKIIFDLGCGTGTLSRILAKSGAEVHGMDSSTEMIKIANSKENNNKYKIEYAVDDALNKFPYEDKFFDLTFQVMILHTIENEGLDQIIREVYRVTKDNGRTYIVIPHPFFVKEFKSLKDKANDIYLTNTLTSFTWGQFNELCDSPTKFFLRPLKEYINIFARQGFLIENIYEPSIINSKEAQYLRPVVYKRRLEIPSFMIIKCLKI